MAASFHAPHNATLTYCTKATSALNPYHYTTTFLAFKAAQGPWACTSASPTAGASASARPAGVRTNARTGVGTGTSTGGGASNATSKA